MSAFARYPQLPPRHMCRLHGGRVESPPVPRVLNGRQIDLTSMFPERGTARTVGEAARLDEVALAYGPPLQHRTSQVPLADPRPGEPTVARVTPDRIARSSAAARLDAWQDLADHALLGACWSMDHIVERLKTDIRLQARLLLEYFWGPPNHRSWSLQERPDVELAIRMPALLGRTHLEGLREAADRALEGLVEFRLDLGEHREIGNMADLLSTGDRSATGLRRGPAVVGPAPLVAPRIAVSFDEDLEDMVDGLGLIRKGTPVEQGAAWALCQEMVRSYAPVHVKPYLDRDG